MLEWIEKHKIATFFIVLVGGIIVFMFLRGGGTTVATSGPDAQAQADSTALQLHQMDTSATLAAASIAAQSNKDIASLAADVQNNKTTAAQTVDLATLDANVQMGSLQLQAIEAQIAGANHAADLAASVQTANINAAAATQQQAQKQAFFLAAGQQQVDYLNNQTQMRIQGDVEQTLANTNQYVDATLVNALSSNVAANGAH